MKPRLPLEDAEFCFSSLWVVSCLSPSCPSGGHDSDHDYRRGQVCHRTGAESRGRSGGSGRSNGCQSWFPRQRRNTKGAKSLLPLSSSKAKDQEIIYLGTMAKLKAMTAEAKAKKSTTLAALKDSQKELADYQNAVEVLKQKLAEVEKAREIQAKAEEERKALGEVKRKTSELEEQKKRELEEAQKRVPSWKPSSRRNSRLPGWRKPTAGPERKGSGGGAIEGGTNGRPAGQGDSRAKG